MDVSILIGIAVSLLSTSVAAATSIRNNKLLQKQNSLIELPFKVNQLQKDFKQLNLVQLKNEHFIDEIAQSAREVLEDILNSTDLYSPRQNYESKIKTRHIFYKIIINLFNAYSYEMPWQSTFNLYERFRRLFDSILDYQELHPNRNKVSLENLYGKNIHLEYQLLNSQEFVQLLSNFCERITLPEKLYQTSINASKPVFSLLRDKKNIFEEGSKELAAWHRLNELERDKIGNSSHLYYEYNAFAKKLNFLESFFL